MRDNYCEFYKFFKIHSDYVNIGGCHRYPMVFEKDKDDYCGEFNDGT
jgi:hypothetical protein